MKKITPLLLSLLVFVTTLVYADPKIEYSEAFTRIGGGANKILQLKNGNTFLMHFSRNGIDVTVYNSKRDVISHKELTSEVWDASKMMYSNLAGLYEINGQPVIFLTQTANKEYGLYRIILDAQTGEITKEKRLKSFHISSNYNFWSGILKYTTGGFSVEKDPYSECYAIAYNNPAEEDINERIKVLHYNGEHKKISAAYLELPKGKYKYVNYVAMAVIGDKQVNLCTYGYNSMRDKGEDARVILSRLPAGDSVFVNKELDFTEDFRSTQAIMKYNKGTGMLNLLTLTQIQSKRNTTYYLALMSYIDPSTLFITGTVPITNEKASAYMQSHLDVDEYQGLPEDMIINPDNTVTVLMEQTRQEIVTRNGAVVSQRTYLGNIGLTVLDTKGKEKDGSAVLKMQNANGLMYPLYLSDKRGGTWSYNVNNGFIVNYNAYLSYDYVSTSTNRYILFNDRPENFDRDEKKKRKMLEDPSHSNTICYKLNNGEMEKFYLFGEPDEHQYVFCNVEASNYQPATNTYCTIVISKKKREDETKLAWIKFD